MLDKTLTRRERRRNARARPRPSWRKVVILLLVPGLGAGTWRATLNSAPPGLEAEANVIGFVLAVTVMMIAALTVLIFNERK